MVAEFLIKWISHENESSEKPNLPIGDKLREGKIGKEGGGGGGGGEGNSLIGPRTEA